MEEASVDHGIDRLRFFLAVFFLSLLAPIPSFATTFGPISVANQVRNTDYVVRGRIVGSSWVMEERVSRRPYTHWKLAVVEQAKGEPLGEEIVIRSPGGELGDLGYHVAGSAQFRGGEEVFVNLKDTDDPAVKEVTGLASGKYTVERGEDGKPRLRSGLGFLLRDEKGAPYTPETFTALARRIAEGKETESDRNVFVTKEVTHDHSSGGFPAVAESPQPQAPAKSPPASGEIAPSTPSVVQETSPPTEEPMGSSSGWWTIALVLGGLTLVGGVALALRR